MKKLLLIFSIALLATGCNNNASVQNNNESSNPNSEEVLAKKIVDERYQYALANAKKVEGLPTDVYPTQVGDEVTINNIKYLYILQPNMNYDIAIPYDDEVKFAGILSSTDGKTWQKFFTINDPFVEEAYNKVEVTHNVQRMYSSNGQLTIDLIDSRGAGSGEGNLTRLISKDGKSWAKTGCYYYAGSQGGPITEKSTECLYQL